LCPSCRQPNGKDYFKESGYPGRIPDELRNYPLTFVEEQVIALVSVNQYVYENGSGGHMTSGHCINFAQDIGRIATVLPRLGSEIGVVVFRKENTATGQNLDLRVRRAYVTKWLDWLKVNGIPAYRNVVIDRQRLADLPTNGELLGTTYRNSR
jgi:hypothetical protein